MENYEIGINLSRIQHRVKVKKNASDISLPSVRLYYPTPDDFTRAAYNIIWIAG